MAGLKVEKKEHENSKQLVNSFLRRLKRSAILKQAKESMYRERSLSRKLKIRAALRREELKRYYKKLEKLGKI